MDFSLCVHCLVVCLVFVFFIPDVVSPSKTHRMECTKEETSKAACLNSGECYAIDLAGNGQRSVFCHCKNYEKGRRCEQEVFRDSSVFRTVAIVLLCLLVVVGAIAVLIIWKTKKCCCTTFQKRMCCCTKKVKNSQEYEERRDKESRSMIKP